MVGLFVAVFVAAAAGAAVEAASADLLGLAAVITAVGVAFASIVSAITLSITSRTSKKVNATADKVTQIDRAVNGQAPETAPMVEQVQDIHAQIDPAELDRAALLPLVRRQVVLTETLITLIESLAADRRGGTTAGNEA